jgi:RHH-type proline utilization regulon transcriptional repressor/proline dehydrogenase/delta 1-pyrroline-5-carboxylate dehydrogenase
LAEAVTSRWRHNADGSAGGARQVQVRLHRHRARMPAMSPPPLRFTRDLPRTPLRAAITAAQRRPETECLPPLIAIATMPADATARASGVARRLVEALRAERSPTGVDALIREYSLSSEEGVALMCLAEALLRIPDDATRDALIRDKVAPGNWRAHFGHSESLFVNAATWGLAITGTLTATASERSLSAALTRLIGLGGEPLIRKGVDLAVRMMGEQFVTGQTIEAALDRGRAMERKGFQYSYDMLGEAALTAADAARYYGDYERAIHAIGRAARGRGPYAGPGISIKLSALHPRYSRAQIERVDTELLPRLKALARLAHGYDIGFNIDAEEADRLELSLDLLEVLCLDPELRGWQGLGFVIQAYQKRCPCVVDFIVDLARRGQRRLMVRLVKGAYWDSEIKRAQVDGMTDFPVYTRKVHTDVCYLACARKLLAAPDAVFPQFATHNAHTLATVLQMAGPDFHAEQYEFQCLHGMGEPLYERVVGKHNLDRPCRIYAPVGTHETLLGYLVRRLLENGANTSFVNRIGDPSVSIDELITDPVAAALAIEPVGAPHPRIAPPGEIFGVDRANSTGLDLSNDVCLRELSITFAAGASRSWTAAPLLGDGFVDGVARIARNPADHADIVGQVVDATEPTIAAAFAHATDAAAAWAALAPAARATCLEAAARQLEARMPVLLDLIIREAGKSAANAVAEVREAVDFLRYYAAEIRRWPAANPPRALGPVVCISPWNFPLAIFTGQVAAALAAGNPVLAKPAEETPLVAAEATRILRAAGVPAGALQLLPGDGSVGAALVADPRTAAVLFTGSTEVAQHIRRQLAARVTPGGRTIVLVAETGGMNAMVVDSSAQPEQVVTDVIASAFDSAGQRCSALRILCVQEDIADRVLALLDGALAELTLGNPGELATDVGPVITAEAQRGIVAHIDAMRARGHRVHQPRTAAATRGTFVPPTLISIDRIADVEREVFGPVLHVLRYRRDDLEHVIDAINATGYALTFGLHTRIDETIARVTARVRAGNVYVNRNIIGAVVGVQPFGGNGRSGTGPKAGGPLYLLRLVADDATPPTFEVGIAAAALRPAHGFRAWLRANGHATAGERCQRYIDRSPLGARRELRGPVGERNEYVLQPRGTIVVLPASERGLLLQIAAALATGNKVVAQRGGFVDRLVAALPREAAERISLVADWTRGVSPDGVLFEGEAGALREVERKAAALQGPLVAVHARRAEELARGQPDYVLEWLLEERSISTNTAAAGGNASLMAIG